MIKIKTINDILIIIEDTYHLTQAQLSKKIEVSSAYVSAVKSGSKSMPKAWITRFQTLFPNCNFTLEELKNAYELSKDEISFSIKEESYIKKVVALKMSGKFQDITDKQAEEILKIIN